MSVLRSMVKRTGIKPVPTDTKKPKNDGLDSYHCPVKDCYKNFLVSDEFESTIKMAQRIID